MVVAGTISIFTVRFFDDSTEIKVEGKTIGEARDEAAILHWGNVPDGLLCSILASNGVSRRVHPNSVLQQGDVLVLRHSAGSLLLFQFCARIRTMDPVSNGRVSRMLWTCFLRFVSLRLCG